MFEARGSKCGRGLSRVGLGVAAAALVIAGCGGSDDASSDDAGETSAEDEAADDGAAEAADTGAVAATIVDFAFDPTPVAVANGSTITWTNEDGAAHTVTGTGDLAFDSGNLGQGESFSLTVDQAGEFAYVCAIHGSMQGTIVVS